jgi:hypothetical protein
MRRVCTGMGRCSHEGTSGQALPRGECAARCSAAGVALAAPALRAFPRLRRTRPSPRVWQILLDTFPYAFAPSHLKLYGIL